MSYAKIVGDKIVIELRIDVLANESVMPDDLMDENLDPLYEVTDAHAFAKYFVDELNREEEDGTTPVHAMFDKAFTEAVENGADGINEIERPEDYDEGDPCTDEDDEEEDEEE